MKFHCAFRGDLFGDGAKASRRHSSQKPGITSPFSRAFATHECIIHVNDIFQPVKTIPVLHCRSNSFRHIARSRSRDIGLFRQTQSRDSAFIGSSQIDCPGPLYQRQIRSVKQNACSQRYKIFALRTLVHLPCGDVTEFFTPTTRTIKTFWPSHLGKSLCTGFFLEDPIPDFPCFSFNIFERYKTVSIGNNIFLAFP